MTRSLVMALNCAALPEELLESELFGIERGVATGVDSRSGRFEDADGGTLLLDEIGDMTPAVQAKVLRVLQERLVERVGGKKTIQVDVRVIAATSRNIEEMMKAEEFREDLYYRLAVFPIRLPPLRERPDDVPDLARHFLAQSAAEHGRGTLVLSDAALDVLVRHDWPGNVRELQNVIERAVLLACGEAIGPEAFAGALGPAHVDASTPPSSGALPASAAGVDGALLDLPYEEAKAAWLDRFDRAFFERVLREHGGNISKAAAAAGLRRQRAHEILRRVDLKAADFRGSGR